MNVYTCNSFEGYYPVGTSAVVVANNVAEARQTLALELESIGLPQSDPLEMVRVGLSSKKVIVLQDGNY